MLDVRLICWNLMKTFNVTVRANSFCDIYEFNANSGPEDNADKIQVFVKCLNKEFLPTKSRCK